MLRTVLLKTIRDSRRALIGYSLGIAALALITAASFPSIKDNTSFDQIIEDYPEALLALFGIDKDLSLTSPIGYVDSQMFGNVVPLLLLIFTIGAGVRALAGEEDKGTMELLLANPVSRSRVVIDKFLALVGTTLALAIVVALSVIVFGPPFSLDLPVNNVLAASFAAAVLALVFGALGLAAGAVTGSRGISIGVASGVAVATFVVNGLAVLVEGLKPVRLFSPWYYYLDSKPINSGLDVADTATLVAATLVFFAVSIWAFERRDVGT